MLVNNLALSGLAVFYTSLSFFLKRCLATLFWLLLIATVALIKDGKFILVYGNTWKSSCSVTIFHVYLFCCWATIV